MPPRRHGKLNRHPKRRSRRNRRRFRKKFSPNMGLPRANYAARRQEGEEKSDKPTVSFYWSPASLKKFRSARQDRRSADAL